MARTLGILFMALALAACGGKSKGSSAKSAQDAKAASQKTGSQATGSTGKATNSGDTTGGVACDATLEGVGFCASDAQIVFCAGGSWWVLDCSALDADAFCGEDTSSGTIDCYVF